MRFREFTDAEQQSQLEHLLCDSIWKVLEQYAAKRRKPASKRRAKAVVRVSKFKPALRRKPPEPKKPSTKPVALQHKAPIKPIKAFSLPGFDVPSKRPPHSSPKNPAA
jgi:hypothetical protein